MISNATTSLYQPLLILVFGIIQVLCGVGLIMSDIIYFATAPIYQTLVYTFSFSGAMLGIFYTITGSFGIAAWQPLPGCTSPGSRKCLLITSMVMSIISCLSAVAMMLMFSMLLSFANAGYHRCDGTQPSDDYVLDEWCFGRGFVIASFVFHSVMLAASLAEAGIAVLNVCKMHSGMTVQPFYPGQYVRVPTVMYTPSQQGQVCIVPLQQGSVAPQYGYTVTLPAPSAANTGYLHNQKI